MNFTMVQCMTCLERTVIEPGKAFKELNCVCKTEVAKPLREIKEYYGNETTIELIGEFKNGDYEIKNVDGSLSYRISKQNFKKQFKRVTNVETTANTPLPDVSEEGDPIDNISTEELRAIAKEKKIKGYSNMKRENLIKRLNDEQQD